MVKEIPANKRHTYIDLIKILSIVGIMFIHTGPRGLYAYQVADTAFLRELYLFLSGPAHCSVQFFFMCSGALLLGREDSYKTLFSRKILKFVVVLLLAQAFNYFYLFRTSPESIYLQHYLLVLFSDQFSAHLWYLYAYIAFLLMLPLVRKMVANMEKQDYYYLFAIYLLFRSTDVLQIVLFDDLAVLNPNFTLSFFAAVDSVFYPILGYYLHKCVDIDALPKKNMAALIALALLSMCVCCWLTEYRFNASGIETPMFSTYRCILAAAIFLGLRVLFYRHPCSDRMSAFLSVAGGCTFGVYLFENVLRDCTEKLYFVFSGFMPSFFAALCWVASAAFVGIALVWLLKKIPLVRSLL